MEKCLLSFVFLSSLCIFADAASFKSRGLPTSVDWRDKGVLPKVRNQGELGDSKAIAIVEAIEAWWAIQHRSVVMASVTEFENCCKNISNAYQCVVDLGGLVPDDVYPRDSKTCMSQKYKPAIFIKGGKPVPQGDEMALMEALVRQPVVVAVDAHLQSFELYSSGVYNDALCSSTKLDHMMLLVGYGTEEDGSDYWLCQNSWGSAWGMDGFIKIARSSKNICGVLSSASYPI